MRKRYIPLNPPPTTAASMIDHEVLLHFHRRLHALCHERGLSVPEVAMQAGLSPAESRALQGELLLHDPKLTTIFALARALKVPPRQLLV